MVGALVAQDRAGTTAAGSASPTATADPSPSRSDGPFDDPALDLIETRLFGPGEADRAAVVDAPHPVEGTERKVWETAVERDGSTEVFRVTYGHDRLYVLAVSHWTRGDDAGELARRLLATFTLDPQPLVG